MVYMKTKYTNDKATQIVLSLLKQYGIKKVVASPGTTNIALVASMQYDSWFEIYSSVDERSAAYMACGISEESGEPVVLTCTGATASRNYFPALTEAYYRKLPIIAITGSHGDELNGHLHPQVIDRTQQPKDTIRFSTSIGIISNTEDEWDTLVKVNKALIELSRSGGGPVHINLRAATGAGYETEQLPVAKKIDYYSYNNKLPHINISKVAIFVGSHKIFTPNETAVIEEFCEKYNAVIFVDHTSGYYGRYSILNALHASQSYNKSDIYDVDLLIHLGEVSGEVYNIYRLRPKRTWRVNEDGEVRDLFKCLEAVFQMREIDFFKYFNNQKDEVVPTLYYQASKDIYNRTLRLMPELPFGNIWIAKQLHKQIPKNSVIHFSIYNSLRSWNFFELDSTIRTQCNVGGFGIDGPVSTLIGASLCNIQNIYYLITGDLAFFYDLNALGNRHIGKNIRILLINNGCGTEFRNYDHPASKWGNDANLYMAAGGHFGSKSKKLVKNYVEDLGFTYMTASNKEEFLQTYGDFISPEITKSIVFEIFTNSNDESNAIRIVRNILENNRSDFEKISSGVKKIIKKII